ncbi:LacI family DNA-binding transcriptional regulator [Xylanimonas ulmi]|uniref:LacI family transcriptional regulator n=1 Tax=Xylanimonas ulmi TaxID=228973 RepID=A0A4Q7M425_9MICO|nr:LacI family DNA-binding transcriptional regulator [Xylanibacterium ulmi]RZS62686.1 LacI family transcriptional regulator [Xylanibacterium ulmi]
MASSDGAPAPAKARLRDVAQEAGVSLSTASKALNDKAEVSPTTRARVREAAERLGFVPNALVHSILAGRSGTVGLITNDLEGRFSLPILRGAEDAFGAGQMSVFLCNGREDAIREQYHLRALLSRRVDGIIVVGSRTNPRPSIARRVSVPVVYAYAPSHDDADVSVVVDNVRAGEIAAEHLVATGRTRIAHITGDATYTAATDRAAGARAALADAGLDFVGPVRYGSWSEAWGRGATAAVLDAPQPVDAILCGSDQIARGALDVLHERAVRVPHDIAVASFDNWEPMIAGTRPSLTSVDMQFDAIGRRAAHLLFAALDGKATPGVERVTPRLVVRGSTVPQA